MFVERAGLTVSVFEDQLFARLADREVRWHGTAQEPLGTRAHACRLPLVYLFQNPTHVMIDATEYQTRNIR